MTEKLRVLLCEDDAIVARDFAKQLEAAGYQVVAPAASGAQAVEQARQSRPDVVLMDIELPDMDGLAAVEAITRERPVAVVVVTAHTEPEFLERAVAMGAFGYVVKPVARGALQPAIQTALARFRDAQALKGEAEGLKESLAGRKIIERAKGLLMERARITEEEAYLTLQKSARNQNVKLADLAQRFLDSGSDWQGLIGPIQRKRA